MTKSEINEIKKQFTIDGCTIDRICGCYVNNEKEKMCVSTDSFLALPDEEMHKYFDILKKSLSGTEGKNLLHMFFETSDETEGSSHKLLQELRKSALKDEELVGTFFDRVIESYDTVEKYYIVLVHASYDVPQIGTDQIMTDDASETVFDYIMCSICPVRLTKAALGYIPDEKRIGERARDWVVADPEKAFMFPLFSDRAADIHGLLYYSKKSDDLMESFTEGIFGLKMPVSADEQAEVFNSVITKTLGDDVSFETVKDIHENVSVMLRQYDDPQEPLSFGRDDVKKLFEKSGVRDEDMKDFVNKYEVAVRETLEDEEADAEDTRIRAANITGTKKFDIKTPDVVIRVNPERTDLISTRVIDGRQCIVIAVNDRVEVNGISCRTVGFEDD
ncbi:MAG: DUF4317 domain-containing protein [Lachnospiraceae bacterium]|nr:DUF4317 domain-containing protein [Lachnospiraceae bacterium]